MTEETGPSASPEPASTPPSQPEPASTPPPQPEPASTPPPQPEPASTPPPQPTRTFNGRRYIPATAAIAVALIALLIVLLLGGSTANKLTPEPLAPDQTLSFPIAQDLSDFDPALISNPGDVDILRNVFSGLYRFDAQLHEVPDIATSKPAISSDGLTYTFHLRHNAQFSNGDSITVDDVIYSWDRAAARQGDFAGLFQIISGYGDVASGKTTQMSGLTRVDDYTLQVVLTKRAGYFLTLTGLWPFWLVDQKVIAAAGEDVWFTKPETLIGSGPFRLTAHATGQSLDFAPVTGWYGGKTGTLTKVHVQVMPDLTQQVSDYESGVFTLIGYGRQGLAPAAATRYTTTKTLRPQLTLIPIGTTFWVGFNMKSGPFAGDAGHNGRHAFSQAIDRAALVDAVCNDKTTCISATGGVISKGLQGYLGDGADPSAKFDPAAAKAEYQAWDPDGSKVKALTYTYDTNAFNKAVCDNLAAQWKKNLGVTVACVDLDRKTYFDSRNGACAFATFRQSWAADYDHPQDWFDYLFVTGASSSGSCYSNPSFDSIIAAADASPAGASAADYKTAGLVLVNDTVYAGLLYGVQQYLVHPWVRGAGGNALYDFDWTGMRIVKH